MQTAKSEKLENIVPIKTSEVLKLDLESGSVDIVLLYDILHYFLLHERKMLYEEVYRILKMDGLLSVYPKHNKMDKPLWNLSGLTLKDIEKEIESFRFSSTGTFLKQLIHDDSYNDGYVINFKKEKGGKGDGN